MGVVVGLSAVISQQQALYRDIYERIRTGIVDGTFKPGERIPSSRVLSGQLGVARGSVEAAYQLLAGEGYIASSGARGTFVSLSLPTAGGGVASAPAHASDAPTRDNPRQNESLAFHVGIPALDIFPRKTWATAAARQARRLTPDHLRYPDARGLEDLRSGIASYLRIARGVECEAEQILVTGGYQSALGLIGRLLIRPGSRVAVENPGYFRTRQVLDFLRVDQVPVSVDAEGLDVGAMIASASDASMCIVTPANQFPLAVAMSRSRRQMLLEWAARRNAWIVEDDYDGEFYYGPRAVPALKSIDGSDRVIYVGTFSKTLFPAIRLGYLVVPRELTALFASGMHALDGGRSAADQAIVADFIHDGHFARHLQRMRTAYGTRRAAALTQLSEKLGGNFEFEGGGGIHVVAWSKQAGSDAELRRRAAKAGFRLLSISESTYGVPARTGLILGITNPPVEQISASVSLLARALDGG